jgi:hypothetical protein
VVVSEVLNPARDAGIQVRIQPYSGDQQRFVQHYIGQFSLDMTARLQTRQDRYIQGLNAVDLAFSAQRAGRDYVLLSRLIIVAQHARVVIVQAGYPAAAQQTMLSVLSGMIDSLWIYRLDRLIATE